MRFPPRPRKPQPIEARVEAQPVAAFSVGRRNAGAKTRLVRFGLDSHVGNRSATRVYDLTSDAGLGESGAANKKYDGKNEWRFSHCQPGVNWRILHTATPAGWETCKPCGAQT